MTARSISTGGSKRQRGHPDRRAGRKGLTEILCVDPIHRDEVAHAREIHAGAHNVIETPAGRFEALAIASDGSAPFPSLGGTWSLLESDGNIQCAPPLGIVEERNRYSARIRNRLVRDHASGIKILLILN